MKIRGNHEKIFNLNGLPFEAFLAMSLSDLQIYFSVCTFTIVINAHGNIPSASSIEPRASACLDDGAAQGEHLQNRILTRILILAEGDTLTQWPLNLRRVASRMHNHIFFILLCRILYQ